MIKIHIKNNRWRQGSFPNTPQGEEIFTITKEHFDNLRIEVSRGLRKLVRDLPDPADSSENDV